MKLRNKIVRVLRKHKDGTDFFEMYKNLQRLGVQESELRSVLEGMKESGRIFESSKDHFALVESVASQIAVATNVLEGEFLANRKGFGFVRTTAGDIFVPSRRTRGALHKDVVLVKRLKPRREEHGLNEEGEVLKIIRRTRTRLVGLFVRRGKLRYVVPSDKRYSQFIFIDSGSAKDAQDRDLVVVEVTHFGDRDGSMRGVIVEILGPENLIGVEIEAIIREHNLRTKFEPEVIVECDALSATPTADELAKRKDLRDVHTVTIDGLDAKDFDDAVSIHKDEAGFYIVHVHIADVSHYVPLGSDTDTEALGRGTSVYLVDRVLPMFPERLSNDLASLRPREDRLTFTVMMKVNADGAVTEYEITEAIINSNYRLTYEEVDQYFKSGAYPNAELQHLLNDMREISDVLEKKRLRRGSLNFETIEPKVELDKELKPIAITIREKTPATKIIEELMILTNETVAHFMDGGGHPAVYRIHDKPDAFDLSKIEELASELKMPFKGVGLGRVQALQKLIEYAHKKPEKFLINNLLLRAMKKAVYSSDLHPHYGLASKEYSHFTSPIRRYPDFILHHLIKRALGVYKSDDLPDIASRLQGICELNSSQEQEADEAERESKQIKIIEFMQQFIGHEFEGIISGIVDFGFFVELPNAAEGLIRANSIQDDYYVSHPEKFCLTGKHHGKVFRLGEKIRVRLINASVGDRRIDFEYIEHLEHTHMLEEDLDLFKPAN